VLSLCDQIELLSVVASAWLEGNGDVVESVVSSRLVIDVETEVAIANSSTLKEWEDNI
jgi:hypothetical protein